MVAIRGNLTFGFHVNCKNRSDDRSDESENDSNEIWLILTHTEGGSFERNRIDFRSI